MKKVPAFTLIECVAALLVTAIVIVLAGFSLTALQTMGKRSLDRPVDWIICLQELESPNHRFALTDVQAHHLSLYDQKQQRHYELRASDRLYLRSAGDGGYMPIFSGIQEGKTCFKKLSDQRVQIEVKRENGQALTGILFFAKAD